METTLIVSSSSQASTLLSDLLKSAPSGGRQVVAASGGEARRMFSEIDVSLVIVNCPLSDEFGHELALEAVHKTTAGVILIVKNEISDEVSARVETDGVLVVPKPVGRAFFYQSVKLAEAARRRLLGLRQENTRLQDKIEEIRLVDRAKCALIQYLGMTEPQAHRYIEKQAMDLRTTRREVAQSVLQTYEG